MEYLKIRGILDSRKYSSEDDCHVNGAIFHGVPLRSLQHEQPYTLPRPDTG